MLLLYRARYGFEGPESCSTARDAHLQVLGTVLSAEAGAVSAVVAPVAGASAGSVVPGGVGPVCGRGGCALFGALVGGEFGFELLAGPVGAGGGEERCGVGLGGDGGVAGELLDALLGGGEPLPCAGGLFGEVGEFFGEAAPAAGGVPTKVYR